MTATARPEAASAAPISTPAVRIYALSDSMDALIQTAVSVRDEFTNEGELYSLGHALSEIAERARVLATAAYGAAETLGTV